MQKHQVAGEAGQRASSWYLRRGDKRYGPLGDRELVLLVERGGLRTDDLLWKPGFSSWKSVHAVCDLKTSPEDTSRKVASLQTASPPVEPTQDASYVPDGLLGDAPRQGHANFIAHFFFLFFGVTMFTSGVWRGPFRPKLRFPYPHGR